MKIIDDKVTGVVVSTGNGTWKLRMTAPTMSQDEGMNDHAYLWYDMEPQGWMSIENRDGEGSDAYLEAAYQKAIKETAQ